MKDTAGLQGLLVEAPFVKCPFIDMTFSDCERAGRIPLAAASLKRSGCVPSLVAWQTVIHDFSI